MNAKISILTIALSSVFLVGAHAAEVTDAMKKEVVATYASIAGHVYADAQKSAEEMEKAIAAYIATPTAETQIAAKNAWLATRLPYAQSEVISVSDEGAEKLGESFKAIELILWGEDKNIEGPGARTSEEFMKAKDTEGPELETAAKAITTAMTESAAAWKEGVEDNRRAKLVAGPANDALAGILKNIDKLASAELAKKRIGKAFETSEQKYESAEYSDTTHLDLIYGASGIANVIAGAYVGVDKKAKVEGAGLLKLAEMADAAHAEKLKLVINRVMLAVTDFRPPFDRALMAPEDSPAREAITEIVDALEALAEESKALSAKLGLDAG